MSKPVSEWDEAYILSLPSESNEFERKGANLLDLTISGVNYDKVADELAKQLSAFANTGGGKIIYGLKDDGTVDGGGISTQIKSGGTKEWFERRIPDLTEYEIVGFNVHEFGPNTAASQIQKGKALYVVDVPDSDRAPHQSKRDMKYYVRVGSQSLPAPHRLIEDIRNRQKHPRISLGEITIDVRSCESTDSKIYAVDLILTVQIVNCGSIKSTDTFLLLKPETGGFRFTYDKEIAVQCRERIEGCTSGNWSDLFRHTPRSVSAQTIASGQGESRLADQVCGWT